MAGRVRQPGSKAPKVRVLAADEFAGFFPNEVVAILALPELNYRQLRFFYRLIRDPTGKSPPGRSWARFTLSDMAALLNALSACGAEEVLRHETRRLTMVGLAEAVRALHVQGYRRPLLQVGLERLGRRVLADINGLLVDPVTGQQALRSIKESGNPYLVRAMLNDARLADLLENEIARHR